MDLAARLQARSKPPSYLDRERERERNGLLDDSSGESESNFMRRKFQRTATDQDVPLADAPVFRKPTLPASATRPPEHPRSFSQRRRSTLRENVRIPSGPREFPSPGKRNTSFSTNAPSAPDPTIKTSFLPYSQSESLLSLPGNDPRLASHSPSSGGAASLRPRPLERTTNNFEFLPDINFDDFQTSLRGSETVLKEFSGFGDVRRPASRDREDNVAGKSNGIKGSANTRTPALPTRETGSQQSHGVGRSSSIRQRIEGGRQATGNSAVAPQEPWHSHLSSFRDRRKSSAPSSMTDAASTSLPAARRPRKSVGPGVLPSVRKLSTDGSQPEATGFDASSHPSIMQTSSFSKTRRTTLQPFGSATADLPRLSTLNATTQARANKAKSLQPPPRDAPDFNTPPAAQKVKGNHVRDHTPSSSGTRRPSNTQSGRASGLGARTISPTDARRLKRQSMANPPPMPNVPSKGTAASQDDLILFQNASLVPELPRLSQPSPSLIPRKTSTATPSSASPDGRHTHSSGGGVPLLASKSSFSSLTNAAAASSASRLPTPRGRSGGQSSASAIQYSDQDQTTETEEIVPPVPAIPKAYESPKDADHQPFFSGYLRFSQSGASDSGGATDPSLDLSAVPPTMFAPRAPHASLDLAASESPKKQSGEFVRAKHRRNLTGGGGGGDSATGMVPPRTAPPRPTPTLPADNSGRQNANRQPLRLPPLNMIPISSRQVSVSGLPRPSQEVDSRDEIATMQTPEPRRVPKTPSTPMTASKATFFRRQEEKSSQIRSSSSHYALRDMMNLGDAGHFNPSVWGDVDADHAVPMPVASAPPQPRNAITPFASGSLPKGSGECARPRGRPSGEYDDDYSLGQHPNLSIQGSKPRGPRGRAQTNGTIGSVNSTTPQTPTSLESPVIETDGKKAGQEKKDKEPGSAGGGLRRRLSMGWRRSSSKAANHIANNKNSPQPQPQSAEKQSDEMSTEQHDHERNKLKKRTDMPPPKLPASATWSGDLPRLPTVGRPSFDAPSGPGHFRRKSNLPPATASAAALGLEAQPSVSRAQSGNRPTRLHTEQPQPVNASSGMRSSSWGNLLGSKPNGRIVPTTTIKHASESSVVSALVKDKDDLLADEEMQRLSRKRKDVDAAALATEELQKRAVPADSMSSHQVLHDRGLSGGSGLNVFERGEVVDYDKDGIFFTGRRSAQKIIGALNSSSPRLSTAEVKDSKGGSNNFGYDDERGDYNIVLGDHLAYRYEVVDVLGKGSFGQVVRCIDHKAGGIVAIKIIRNKKRFHQQALVEVGILGKLKEWDPDGSRATLSVTGSFYFRNHLCIVTPCLSINLYELIRAHNFVGFQLPLIRRFARQLLACLTLLQTKKIIHCDLKPENILLCDARKADVRVIDFGSSCREEEKVYTYIQSRFYRSPEVILGSTYGLGIDMWSLGCILAELWTGYPLFPGENEQEQLACIMEIFGPPDRHLVERCTRKKLFFDSVGKPRVTVSSKGRRRRPSSKTLAQALKSDDEAFVDFVTRCLRWDPDRRLQPSDAVSHPFILNQPLHPRPGISDEARRATRAARPTAVAPLGTVPSPVKRSANAFAQQQQQSSLNTTTVIRDRKPPTNTDPSQSVLRGPSLNPSAPTAMPPPTSSPSKVAMGMKEPSRRHSAITTASAAAMAGSKRASNGALLAGNSGSTTAQAAGQPHLSAANVLSRAHSGNLAAIAARESMAGAAAAAAGGGLQQSGGGGMPLNSSTSSLTLAEVGSGGRGPSGIGQGGGAARWRV